MSQQSIARSFTANKPVPAVSGVGVGLEISDFWLGRGALKGDFTVENHPLSDKVAFQGFNKTMVAAAIRDKVVVSRIGPNAKHNPLSAWEPLYNRTMTQEDVHRHLIYVCGFGLTRGVSAKVWDNTVSNSDFIKALVAEYGKDISGSGKAGMALGRDTVTVSRVCAVMITEMCMASAIFRKEFKVWPGHTSGKEEFKFAYSQQAPVFLQFVGADILAAVKAHWIEYTDAFQKVIRKGSRYVASGINPEMIWTQVTSQSLTDPEKYACLYMALAADTVWRTIHSGGPKWEWKTPVGWVSYDADYTVLSNAIALNSSDVERVQSGACDEWKKANPKYKDVIKIHNKAVMKYNWGDPIPKVDTFKSPMLFVHPSMCKCPDAYTILRASLPESQIKEVDLSMLRSATEGNWALRIINQRIAAANAGGDAAAVTKWTNLSAKVGKTMADMESAHANDPALEKQFVTVPGLANDETIIK